MSEAFNEFLAKREAAQRAGLNSQRWFFIALGAVFAIVFIVLLLRGDPSKRPVNPNTATAEQLATLPEVGPVLAKAIISKRAEKTFKKPEDLLDVKGIGKATLEKMRPRLRFEP